MDRILLSHPYVAHLLLYDPEHGVIMRSQPDRLKNDPGFRDEADHWSRFAEGWWRLEYDDLTKKLAKMPNTGTPYLFEDQWMPRGDRHVYSDMAMFLKTDEETGTRSIAGIVFDPGYLRDRFFPQVLNEVMSRSVAEEQTDKDAVVMQHGFTLEEKIGEVPPLEVDREAMARNLVNNALKYSQDRKYIGVNLYRDNGCVTLEVVDHGIGIPASELHKIFQKFYRVGDPLVHNTKGSGLGLSLVQHIARAHGGDVMVDSTPGAGSKFTISLPLDRDGQSTKAASA